MANFFGFFENFALQMLLVVSILADQMAPLEGPFGRVVEVLELEGFGQVVVGAFPQALAYRPEVAEPRDHDHLDVFVDLLQQT